MSDLRVGPFQLRRVVAEHDDEQLWLAERVAGERPPRWVAIRRARQAGSAAAERLLLEYDALRGVSDPRVPAVVGHFPGKAALAVAWVPGQGLDRATAAHRSGLLTLDAATVLELGAELISCLRVVHKATDASKRPLVHGHLGLDSIRVAPDGSVFLLGLGRPHRRPPPSTCAPELLGNRSPTPASDRWAVGAILVELLGGSPVLDGAGRADRLEGRVDPWVQPIASVNPELGRILERLLAPDAAARFPDEGELLRALRQVQRKLPGVADPAALGQALAELPAPSPSRPAPQAPAPTPRPTATPPDPGDLPPTASPRLPPEPALGQAELGEAELPGDAPPIPPQPEDFQLDDATEPLDPGNLPPFVVSPLPGLAPKLRPATARRLGLGELVAIVAIAVLLVVGIVVLVQLG